MKTRENLPQDVQDCLDAMGRVIDELPLPKVLCQEGSHLSMTLMDLQLCFMKYEEEEQYRQEQKAAISEPVF